MCWEGRWGRGREGPPVLEKWEGGRGDVKVAALN